MAYGGPLEPINSIIANNGAQNDITVINYGDALCGCVGSTGGVGVGSTFLNGGPYMTTTSMGAFTPTNTGYALMTVMAQTAINTLNLKLTGGYLQNVEQYNENEDFRPVPDANSVTVGAVLQFTPYGEYPGIAAQPLMNSNYAGATGTWTSSNPLVVYVSKTGLAWSLSPGIAIVTYTAPSGVKFSEWIMYVTGS